MSTKALICVLCVCAIIAVSADDYKAKREMPGSAAKARPLEQNTETPTEGELRTLQLLGEWAENEIRSIDLVEEFNRLLSQLGALFHRKEASEKERKRIENELEKISTE